MTSLREIHPIAQAVIEKRFSIKPVVLKYPLPERPVRTLGLLKIEGEVFSSDKFTRVVFLRFNFPFYLAIRSTFVRPRMEYGLPVFSAEVVIMGKKRMFMVDVQGAGERRQHDDSALFGKLIKIRDKYPGLLKTSTTLRGEIQNTFSKAACQVRITEGQDEEALSLFKEYLGAYLEMVEEASPLLGERLEQAKQDFEGYLKTVVDHDPGVKVNKILFGKEGGVKRALDIFFDR